MITRRVSFANRFAKPPRRPFAATTAVDQSITRTQIRALGLGTNQHHPPLEALLAQRLRGLGAGQARASDDEYLLAHLILSRVTFRTQRSPGRSSYRVRELSSQSVISKPTPGGT